MTEVINCRVKYIKPDNLELWLNKDNNVYIGRNGRIFINKKIFHYKGSIWKNPYTVKKYGLEESLTLYEDYIREKIKIEPEIYNIELLRNKILGCWCKPNKCHGDILLKILKEKSELDNNELDTNE